jgi:hypothetical protein
MKLGIAIIYFICIVACTALAEFKPIEGVTLEEMLGGDNIKRIITTSPEIEILRLGNSRRQTSSTKFATSRTPDVIAALTDINNYGERYLCEFDPGVTFRFATDEGTLDIVICFTCGEMRLYLNGSIIKRDIPWVGNQNSFSPAARRTFVALAQTAFPDDPQIQSLQ